MKKTERGQIIVEDKQGNEYVLQMFVASEDAFVPYIDSPIGLPKEKYWEHFWSPKEDWIRISKVNWSEFNMTKEQYLELKGVSDKQNKKILAKYQGSF